MLAAKLLEQNPEVYTVWNYRREALLGVLKVSQHCLNIQRAQGAQKTSCC